MANHSATKKAIRKTVSKTEINKTRKSRIKTYIKRVITAVEAGSSEESNKALVEAQSEIMRGVANNLMKKNTAARKVSRLSKKVKAISTGAAVGTAKTTEQKATKPKTVSPEKATAEAGATGTKAKPAAVKKPATTKAKPAVKKEAEKKSDTASK
ncbi:MAG: 30S ribosomal protein S20 [Rickettsiales bacterium]|nr:MAG: 30S ribosomal protein S20 [Rickettsiales bacterium]